MQLGNQVAVHCCSPVVYNGVSSDGAGKQRKSGSHGDRQVVKDAVYRGQNWAAKQTGLQTSEVLPGDRKQKENRAEGKEERALSCIPSQNCRQRAAQCPAVRRSRGREEPGNLSSQSSIIIW